LLALIGMLTATPIPMSRREKEALTRQLAEAQARLVDERSRTMQDRVRLEEEQENNQRLDVTGKQSVTSSNIAVSLRNCVL
jgi:hypothetical protein